MVLPVSPFAAPVEQNINWKAIRVLIRPDTLTAQFEYLITRFPVFQEDFCNVLLFPQYLFYTAYNYMQIVTLEYSSNGVCDKCNECKSLYKSVLAANKALFDLLYMSLIILFATCTSKCGDHSSSDAIKYRI